MKEERPNAAGWVLQNISHFPQEMPKNGDRRWTMVNGRKNHRVGWLKSGRLEQHLNWVSY